MNKFLSNENATRVVQEWRADIPERQLSEMLGIARMTLRKRLVTGEWKKTELALITKMYETDEQPTELLCCPTCKRKVRQLPETE